LIDELNHVIDSENILNFYLQPELLNEKVKISYAVPSNKEPLRWVNSYLPVEKWR
jgi:hypothetical protein